jgi:ATP-dependent helicase/DNAse subunit B
MDKETGVLVVLMERLEKQRLPRILALKEKVDGGKKLDDTDLDYMEKMIKDAKKALPLIERHPEYQPLAAQLIDLYEDITDKGLQLEKGS